jgi:hypothetical protein
MTIARKPKPTAPIDVDALINKGGTVAGQAPESQGVAKPSAVVVRIPSDMLDGIELARAARAVRIPRHTWLLEAIAEKLAREQGKPPA